MNALIGAKRPEIAELCRRYLVKRLDLFGSAAAGPFDPDRSDLDFLVEFVPMELVPYKRSFFDLLAGLTELFGRRIDLVTAGSLRKPYFIRAVTESRQVVYAL